MTLLLCTIHKVYQQNAYSSIGEFKHASTPSWMEKHQYLESTYMLGQVQNLMKMVFGLSRIVKETKRPMVNSKSPSMAGNYVSFIRMLWLGNSMYK